MKLEDVQPNGQQLILASEGEVDAFAARLWITFPAGYRDYVTRLGEGLIAGFVRIFAPWRIEKELAPWRQRIKKHWFWDDGRDVLPKERALECIVIGDTVNGDELLFHPHRPNSLFVLPRDSEQVLQVGDHLLSAIDRILTSGELIERTDQRNFEPFDSRLQSSEDDEEGSATSDPDGESLAELVERAEEWAKRHAVKKAASKELRSRTPKGAKTELLFESLLIDGPSALHIGYGIAWRIIDKETGDLRGTFRWNKGEGHQGSEYTPANSR